MVLAIIFSIVCTTDSIKHFSTSINSPNFETTEAIGNTKKVFHDTIRDILEGNRLVKYIISTLDALPTTNMM